MASSLLGGHPGEEGKEDGEREKYCEILITYERGPVRVERLG